MKIAKLFLIFFICLFLTACINTDYNSEVNEISNKIGQEQSYRQEQASGAIHATKKILDDSPNEDIHTESARKTIDIAEKASSPLSIEERSRWDEVAEELLGGSTAKLEKVQKELIQSENKQSDLKKKLQKAESERLVFYERLQRDADARIEELKQNQELKKKLMMYFAGLAAISVIAGGVLTWILGFRIGLNAFIAAGFFGLAAYLITQTFFAYIASGFAIVMFLGTGYYIWGRLRPEKTMAKTADVLEKMEKSPEGHKANAAKLVKKEIGNSLTGKEGEAHKKYIKSVKQKIK